MVFYPTESYKQATHTAEHADNIFLWWKVNNFIMDSTFIPPDNEPKREEWALINNQQALEYQKFKEFEKQKSREKQQKFRMELDQQNTGRADAVKF